MPREEVNLECIVEALPFYHNDKPVDISMSVACVHKKAYIRKLGEGTTIVAGEQESIINSMQDLLQGQFQVLGAKEVLVSEHLDLLQKDL